MSSFGVKNILRKDIVTYDVFFNTNEDIVDYLTIKCLQFNYTHLPSDDVVKSRISPNDAMIIKDCMKHHLMIFAPNEPVLARNTFVHVMRVCDSTLKNSREMTFLFMLNRHAAITLVMMKNLTLSIRQSRYLIF